MVSSSNHTSEASRSRSAYINGSRTQAKTKTTNVATRSTPVSRRSGLLQGGQSPHELHLAATHLGGYLTDGNPKSWRASCSRGWRSPRRSCRPACSRPWRAHDRCHLETRGKARYPAGVHGPDSAADGVSLLRCCSSPPSRGGSFVREAALRMRFSESGLAPVVPLTVSSLF